MKRRDELWVLRRCGRVGHQLAWLDDPCAAELQARDVDDAPLLACLRCGTFVSPESKAVTAVYGTADARVALGAIPLVVRGAHGRKLALLKLLAIERGLRALALLAAAVVVFSLSANRDTVIAKVNEVIVSAGPLAAQIGWDISHSHSLDVLHELLGSSPTAYAVVGFALIAYGIVQLVEAYGLWGGWRWAEYLAAIATAAFLPLEIYEIANHPTVLKSITVVVNAAIVAYLVFKGRLFGVRGGHRAWLAEIRSATLLGSRLALSGRSPGEQTSTVLV